MQAQVNAPQRVDASAPENWGSGMYESAVSMLKKLEKEERAILEKMESAASANDTATFALCERQLSAQVSHNDDGVTPLRIRIADMKRQIAVFHQTPIGRALLKKL